MAIDLRQAWEDFRRDGSERSFEPLYERTKAVVYTICRRLLPNEEDARDAFQAAYAKIIALARDEKAASAMDDAERQIPRIAVREAWALEARLRRRGKRETAMDPAFFAPDTNAPPADQAAAQAQMRARVETLLAALPDRHRVPLLLHYFQDMTHAEIGQALGQSPGKISYRIRRGLSLLEPLARKAGLKDWKVALGAGFLASELLQPPAAGPASAIFGAASASAAAAVAGSAGASGLAAKFAAGAAIVKTKAGAAIAAGAFCAIILVSGIVVQRHMLQGPRQTGASSNAASLQVSASPGMEGLRRIDHSGVADGAAGRSQAAPSSAPASRESTRKVAVQVVWKKTGSPVAGAAVSLYPLLKSWDALSAASPECKATTGPDGMASLEAPAKWASVTLSAAHPEASDVFLVTSAPWRKPVRLEMRPGGTVFGRVRMEGDGRPAPGAAVWLASSSGKAIRETRADSQGDFVLSQISAPDVAASKAAKGKSAAQVSYYYSAAPQQPLLCAKLGRFVNPARGQEGESIPLEAGKRLGPYTILLRKGDVFRGAVMDAATGKPIPGATVGAATATSTTATISDQSGAFRIEGLNLSRLSAYAHVEGYAIGSIFSQERGDEPLEKEWTFRLWPGGELTVVAVDEDGHPVADVTVHGEGAPPFGFQQSPTDAEGRTVLKNVALDRGLKLYLYKQGLWPNSNTYYRFPHGQTKAELTVALQRRVPQIIRGVVLDSERRPAADVRVTAAAAGGLAIPGGQVSTDSASTDAQGRFTLELDPKNLASEKTIWRDISAKKEGLGTASKIIAYAEGMAPVELILAASDLRRQLRGTVVDEAGRPLAGMQVWAFVNPRAVEMGHRQQKSTDREGKFVFDNWIADEGYLNVNLAPGQGAYIYRNDLSQIQNYKTKIGEAPILTLRRENSGKLQIRVIDAETKEPVKEFFGRYRAKNGQEWLGVYGSYYEGYNQPGVWSVGGRLDSEFTVCIGAKGYEPQEKSALRPAATATARRGGAPASETVFALAKAQDDDGKSKEIAGRVIDGQTKAPVARAVVTAASYAPDSPVVPMQNSIVSDTIYSEADGSFRVPRKSLFRQILTIGHPQYAPFSLLPEQWDRFGGQASLTIPLQPGAVLTGVAYRDGRPLANDYVALKGDQSGGGGQTDGLGRYRIEGLRPGRVTVSTKASSLFCLSWVARETVLSAGREQTLNLGEGLGGCSLSGRVLDGDGPSPLPVAVVARPLFSWDYKEFGALANDGRYSIRGLFSGEYEIQLRRVPEWQGDQPLRVELAQVVGHATRDFNFRSGPASGP